MGLFSKKEPTVTAYLTNGGKRLKGRFTDVSVALAFGELLEHLGLELEADRRVEEGCRDGDLVWLYTLKFVNAPKKEAPDA